MICAQDSACARRHPRPSRRGRVTAAAETGLNGGSAPPTRTRSPLIRAVPPPRAVLERVELEADELGVQLREALLRGHPVALIDEELDQSSRRLRGQLDSALGEQLPCEVDRLHQRTRFGDSDTYGSRRRRARPARSPRRGRRVAVRTAGERSQYERAEHEYAGDTADVARVHSSHPSSSSSPSRYAYSTWVKAASRRTTLRRTSAW